MPAHDLDFRQALGGAFERGDVLDGKYQLEEILGIGGMGVVVAARHRELDERVAVKFLAKQRETSREARERFRREARAGFRMSSEHAVRVLDLVFPERGVPYMVLELLDGSDFAFLLARHGRFRPDRAVGYLLQVCEAVAEAHALGIVHRDLKPDNLFLCRHANGAPCVKVLDFGLAKVEHIDHALTRINKGLGTPQYMAPEQWVSAAEVGPAADIWALGIILYEMLTGVPPFDAPVFQELSQLVLFAKPTPIGDIVTDVPEPLAAVVMRCLEKRPQQRYGNIAELAAALLPFAPLHAADAGARVGEELELGRGALASWGVTLSQPSALGSDTRVDTPSRAAEHAARGDGATVVEQSTRTGQRRAGRGRKGAELAPRPAGATASHDAPEERPRSPPPVAAPPERGWRRGAAYVAAAVAVGLLWGALWRAPSPETEPLRALARVAEMLPRPAPMSSTAAESTPAAPIEIDVRIDEGPTAEGTGRAYSAPAAASPAPRRARARRRAPVKSSAADERFLPAEP